MLRVVRDILYHAPEGIGTDTVKALDVVNHVLHRRAIVFLISDFESSGDQIAGRAALRRAMRQTNRRHDLIAVHVEDPHERELPNVGILALEDAETGEVVELDTASAAVRGRFKEQALERGRRLVSDFRSEGVDTLQLQTDSPYLPALAAILQSPRAQTRMSKTASLMRGALAAARSRASWAPPSRRQAPRHRAAYRRTSATFADRSFPVPWLPALLAGGAALALCGYGAWRWRRRRRSPRVLLPFEAALQRLEEIRALMQPENAREFSIAVSDIVRGYIEQGFQVTATHRTTEEFLRDLLESPDAALARHRALLSEFLHQCDLVKFAGMSLTLQNMDSLYHSACEFVRATADRTHDSLPST